MRTLLAVAFIALAAWLTFFPMFDATKRGEGAWPWIVGGLITGPLSGVAYLLSRHGARAAERRAAS